jgi:hypothetical protein
MHSQGWTYVRPSERLDTLYPSAPVQDPDPFCTCAFSYTGPTSAYPHHYSQALAS